MNPRSTSLKVSELADPVVSSDEESPIRLLEALRSHDSAIRFDKDLQNRRSVSVKLRLENLAELPIHGIGCEESPIRILAGKAESAHSL
ncbi:hypothetical protein AK812_SmicGene21510 [Symbiodinium microadriaticum]|uniref:Uncharacterized protein n=1 Tax=Symbiodinium microadriaticum TaxID=2951 RepID=A0A1Q9DM95_SYMMI|nr:hypothetical protein AK812_SmicGene21510 [Symbiodinium microadriaticum]